MLKHINSQLDMLGNIRHDNIRRLCFKLLKPEYTEQSLKTAREKWWTMYEGIIIWLTSCFLSESMETRKKFKNIFELLKGEKKTCQPRILYLVEGEKPFKNEGKGEIKILSHKGKRKDTSPRHLLYLQYKRQKYAERK